MHQEIWEWTYPGDKHCFAYKLAGPDSPRATLTFHIQAAGSAHQARPPALAAGMSPLLSLSHSPQSMWNSFLEQVHTISVL